MEHNKSVAFANRGDGLAVELATTWLRPHYDANFLLMEMGFEWRFVEGTPPRLEDN
jgi:hypothetical protein